MKRTLTLLLSVAVALTALAASDSQSILVFRTGGAVESINVAALSTIEMREVIDADTGDKTLSQCFVLGDSLLTVPVAEIDSVTMGVRNAVEPRPGARRILDSELPYITSFDGSQLAYRSSAPMAAVPQEGERVYYDGFCDTFPYGLCARVDKRADTANGTILTLTEIAPGEIFDQYLVSGDFDVEGETLLNPADKTLRTATAEGGFHWESDFDQAPVKIEAKAGGKLSFRNFVGNLLSDYYRADIYLSTDLLLKLAIESEDSREAELESPRVTLARAVVGGVLYPRLDAALFCDLKASLQLGVTLERENTIHLLWTHNASGDRFDRIDDGNDTADAPDTDTATVDLLLEGSLHTGLMLDLSFNTLFNRVGAGIEAKVGPEIKGEFGFGAVRSLAAEGYDSELFAKANLTTSLLSRVTTYVYHLDNIAWGEQVKTDLPFRFELRGFTREWPLLPELHCRAVAVNGSSDPYAPAHSEPQVDIAADTDTKLIRDVEVGAELADAVTDETITQLAADTPLTSGATERQGYNLRLPRPDAVRAVTTYPTMKYAGYTLRGERTDPMKGAAIAEAFFTATTSGAYAVGGAPIIGLKSEGTTTFIVGNLLPVIMPNPVFHNNRTAKVVSLIDADGKTPGGDLSIYGTWEGTAGGREVTLTLAPADESSAYNGLVCNAVYNSPQGGYIKLSFADGRTLLLGICSVTPDNLTLRFGSTPTPVTLRRK